MCFSVNKRRYNSIQRNIPCTFCRDAGKKCVWVETGGGPRTCQRCHQKGINCSGPTPTGALQVPQQKHFLLSDEEHLAVAALPFHHVVGDHSADYSVASNISTSTGFQALVPAWGHYNTHPTSPSNSSSTASGSGFSSPVDVKIDNPGLTQRPYPYPQAASSPFQAFFSDYRDWSPDNLNLNSAEDESSFIQFSSLSNAEGVYQAAYSAVRVDAGGTEDYEFEAPWSNDPNEFGNIDF